MSLLRIRGWTDELYRRKGTWEAWNAFLTVYNAIQDGYTDQLHPTLGREFDIEAVKEKIRDVEYKWEQEMKRRADVYPCSGAPPLSKMPISAQMWLYEQLETLKENKPSFSLEDW